MKYIALDIKSSSNGLTLDDIKNRFRLAETIQPGAELQDISVDMDGDKAASDITDAVINIINDNERFKAFCDFDKPVSGSKQFFRLGEQICVYWVESKLLVCGTAEEHAARQVEHFEQSEKMTAVMETYGQEELEGVAHLVADNFLGFVIGERLEAYPIQMGLPTIVNNVYQERKFGGLEVPDEAEFNKLMEELKPLTFTQQQALSEIIEAQRA